MTYLNKLHPGQRGTILQLTGDSKVCRRLMELGLMPGRVVTHLRNAPLRDPMQVQVGPCCLSLRHAEAELVAVELED